jgi:raffinose/stachyose/melibiose transport system permease protein
MTHLTRKTQALLLGPALVVFGLFVLLPIGYSFFLSLHSWSGGPKMKFIGLNNYAALVGDLDFWGSFLHNLFLVVFCLVGQILLGFLVAVFMMSKLLKFKELHRTVLFFPVVLSAVIVGFMWSMIYNPDFGFLPRLLKILGLSNWVLPYLDDPGMVMIFVSLPIVWQYVGLYMVIFLTGYQTIEPSLFEMAQIDGANAYQRMMHLTVPLLSETFGVALMLCIAGNMKIFDHIFVMTGGGPGKSSQVMALYAYNQAFEMFRLGYSSAVSIGIIVLSLGLILLSRRFIGEVRQ